MIRIISQKPAPLPKLATCTCRTCESVFTYEGEDIKNVEWFGLAIDCPVCGTRNNAEKLEGYPEDYTDR
jgi:hypothetical protein